MFLQCFNNELQVRDPGLQDIPKETSLYKQTKLFFFLSTYNNCLLKPGLHLVLAGQGISQFRGDFSKGQK